MTQFHLNALNRYDFIHFKLIKKFLYLCQNIIFSILRIEYALNLTSKNVFLNNSLLFDKIKIDTINKIPSLKMALKRETDSTMKY